MKRTRLIIVHCGHFDENLKSLSHMKVQFTQRYALASLIIFFPPTWAEVVKSLSRKVTGRDQVRCYIDDFSYTLTS